MNLFLTLAKDLDNSTAPRIHNYLCFIFWWQSFGLGIFSHVQPCCLRLKEAGPRSVLQNLSPGLVLKPGPQTCSPDLIPRLL